MVFAQKISSGSQHLAANDNVLRLIIDQHGACTLTPHTNYYEELVSSIISQQLSVKAASTIWDRFIGMYGGKTPTPEQILNTDIEQIRSVGVSYAKAHYIQDLAQHIVDRKLDLEHIANLDNITITEQLTAVKGIGEWSAHMFMIFGLGRLDILPWGDLGVRKSIQNLYHLPELPSKQEVELIATENNWSPYQSIAAWYLWKNLDNKN